MTVAVPVVAALAALAAVTVTVWSVESEVGAE
jgi:hypothetical protein